MKEFRIPLRVVFYKEEKRWIAHCLEFDLCGDGTTKEEALEQLSVCIGIQLEESLKNHNLLNLFSPASSDVQGMFFAGKDTAEGDLHLTVEQKDSVVFEEPEYREYSDDRADSDPGLVPA